MNKMKQTKKNQVITKTKLKDPILAELKKLMIKAPKSKCGKDATQILLESRYGK